MRKESIINEWNGIAQSYDFSHSLLIFRQLQCPVPYRGGGESICPGRQCRTLSKGMDFQRGRHRNMRK